jgi:hypothetical protein
VKPENRNQIRFWCDLNDLKENWRFVLSCAAVIGGILVFGITSEAKESSDGTLNL